MSEWIADFYDLLSADYHSMYADWRSEVLRQGKILDALIRRHLGERQVSVLDCTSGIGTQAIGLATCGYNVYATDLSAAAVQRARREAESFGGAYPICRSGHPVSGQHSDTYIRCGAVLRQLDLASHG